MESVTSSGCSVGIIITSHNRCVKTVACIRALGEQQVPKDLQWYIYLADAGSDDETREAIRTLFPEVNLIECPPNLYWCAGMRVAFAAAMEGEQQHDYYLWLNDDAVLYPDAFQVLARCAGELESKEGRAGIVVGSMRDTNTGRTTYGGLKRVSKLRPLGKQLVEPGDAPVPCDTMHGNCVLIANEVAQSVGNLSRDFVHRWGDVDYGLRARNQGIPIWVAPGHAGECARNPRARWKDPAVSFSERLTALRDPKGVSRKEWLVYVRRHGGVLWPQYIVGLYVRAIFPQLWRWLGKGWIDTRGVG